MDNERGWAEQEKEGDVRETERARETERGGWGDHPQRRREEQIPLHKNDFPSKCLWNSN